MLLKKKNDTRTEVSDSALNDKLTITRDESGRCKK